MSTDLLLDAVFSLLEHAEGEELDVVSVQALRHVVGGRPAAPMAKGLCPVCGNHATVLDGLMGLHSRSPHDSGWCRGYGCKPMRMVES